MAQPETPGDAIRAAVARQKAQREAIKAEAERIAAEREAERIAAERETAGQ